jgi:5'-phosphate synthase pdxT subunit
VAGSPSAPPRVGVLALQGDFREHLRVVGGLGAEPVSVRRPEELASVDALIIPGGESSVMDKLSRTFVYGTCAGLIMLADTVIDAIPGQRSLGGLDIAVRRNAFGNQLDSFETDLDIPQLGAPDVHAVFIRAPVVESVGLDVTVLASLADGRVVAVESGNLLGTAFHPEVTGDTRFHQYFLNRVRDRVAARVRSSQTPSPCWASSRSSCWVSRFTASS